MLSFGSVGRQHPQRLVRLGQANFAPTWVSWVALPLPAWLRFAGVGLGLVTALLFLWIHRALRRNWAMPAIVQEGHTLVTSSPCQWVRHPMYSLLFVWAVAYFLMSANGIYSRQTRKFLPRISAPPRMRGQL